MAVDSLEVRISELEIESTGAVDGMFLYAQVGEQFFEALADLSRMFADPRYNKNRADIYQSMRSCAQSIKGHRNYALELLRAAEKEISRVDSVVQRYPPSDVSSLSRYRDDLVRARDQNVSAWRLRLNELQ